MADFVDPRQPLIDLENKKFRQGTGPDDIGVKVFLDGVGNPLNDFKWDSYKVTYNTLTDVVEYYQGGLTGTLLITFTATYSTARKKNVISGVWS